MSEKSPNLSPLDKAIKERNRLSRELKEAKEKIQALEADRKVFRSAITNEIRLQINCMANKNYYQPEALIKRMTQTLSNAESFYLGL